MVNYFGVFYANITNVIKGLSWGPCVLSKLHERDVNAPFSRKQRVAVYRNIENMLINPARGESSRDVTWRLLQRCNMCFQKPGRRFQTNTATTSTTSWSWSTRSGEVPQLQEKPNNNPRQLCQSVSLESLGGVGVGESSCSLQRGSETAQHGCRPEDQRTRFPLLVGPVWAGTGFTGWKFGDGIRSFSPRLDESLKGLQTKGEKQLLILTLYLTRAEG